MAYRKPYEWECQGCYCLNHMHDDHCWQCGLDQDGCPKEAEAADAVEELAA